MSQVPHSLGMFRIQIRQRTEDQFFSIRAQMLRKDKRRSLHRQRLLPCTTWLDAKDRASISQEPEEDSTPTAMTTMTTLPEKEMASEDRALEKASDPEALLGNLPEEAAEAEAAVSPLKDLPLVQDLEDLNHLVGNRREVTVAIQEEDLIMDHPVGNRREVEDHLTDLQVAALLMIWIGYFLPPTRQVGHRTNSRDNGNCRPD